MSILNSSYEISVWLDKLVNGIFQEERICVIGSDTMLFEGRTIEPRLTRNINGEKKFSFKMYKRFVDTITGEEIENPFSEYLINEAKVKLYYKDKWYDFYVKNVVENSSTYLYTYDLADASVQELSKNGYGVTLDAKLMNNLGTAKKLAEATLEDTDWTVESEVFVEKVVDNLVYIRTKNGISNVHWVKDQDELNAGVNDSITISIPEDKELLGFYSSCKNKPHRFQFIYLEDGYDKTNVQLDQDNNIINADCHYYIEVSSPQTEYVNSGDFYLPNNFQVVNKTNVGGDTTISTWYKAKRYGFAQETKYIPLLDRYCNLYKKDNKDYYGYLDSKYTSPVLVTNIITNADFKGNTGWTGTYLGNDENYKNLVGAKVEPICGRFVSRKFQSAMDDLQNGNYNEANNKYTNYFKMEFPPFASESYGVVINSGFYDNRDSIDLPQNGDRWRFEAKIYRSDGEEVALHNFDIYLANVNYNTDTGGYVNLETWGTLNADEGVIELNGVQASLTEAAFKSKSIKLVITPKDKNGTSVYYIESISLYKEVLNGTTIIKPGDLQEEGIVINSYVFIAKSQLEGSSAVTKTEDLVKNIIPESQLTYDEYGYIPQYNIGAEKVRTITVRESNYFNILQSIAETFECWMDIVITRDKNGGATHKKVCFKNFTGNDNYACFRYGVNLKDIQRTYESKQLTTKLIVKQNNNQLAENGFCTIARAGANPTGENYIYDFQYYHKTGLLDATNYQAAMYYHTNPLSGDIPKGPDVDETYSGEAKDYEGTNLQNYFNRIKSLNTKIEPINDTLTNLNMDLLKLKVDLTIQEGLVEAAKSGIDESREEFFGLTGLYPTQLDFKKILSTDCYDGSTKVPIGYAEYESAYNYVEANPSWALKNGTVDISATKMGPINSLVWKFDIALSSDIGRSDKPRTFYIEPIFELKIDDKTTIYKIYRIPCTIPVNCAYGQGVYQISSEEYTTKTCAKVLQEYVTYQQEKELAEGKVVTLKNATTLKEEDIADKQTELQKYTDQKKVLNLLFYSQYSRFIQEGTWMSEDYVDDNKYYNDASSVLYNSCYPQVAYNINVLALNKLPGYEAFDFEIGENTYVEDSDFLGQDTDGNDIRVRVAITEMTENLDDPTQDNIKVQNFKNDFADLFHKITATVQQAQYNSGAYEKAVELAEADAELKSAFLQEGLQSMSAALTVGGQDTVVSDTNGITITDSNTKNQLRLVGGAILMGIEDEETGIRKWKTGLTPEGISASLIQAGTINTGVINIMNATEPTFKWDSFGISAYDVDWTGGSPNGRADPSKFVRYDKYGIYGINSDNTANKVYIDGSSWHPSSMDEIRDVAQFALTWDGLYLRLGNGTYTNNDKKVWHTSMAMLGKVDDKIYNAWDNHGIPYYEDKTPDAQEFVKVFQVGRAVGDGIDGQLVIYDDGTITANNIKLTGSIQWTAASSPYKQVFARAELAKPDNETWYNQFEEKDNAEGIWHKIYDKDKDLFYCQTSDGGATWEGPIPLTGRSITGSTIEYAQGQAGISVEQIAAIAEDKWKPSRPTQLLPSGYCVYTRVRDLYNFGDPSPYRYNADGMNGEDGEDTITCYIESSAGTAFEASATGTTRLTAYIYEGSTEIDLSNKEIYWYIEGQETSFANGNGVIVNIANIRGKTIYFEVDAGGDDTSVLALARVGKMILAKA